MINDKTEFRYPKWLVVASTIVLLVGLAALLVIIKMLENANGWLYFAFLALFYLPATIVVDMAGSVLWDRPRWGFKAIPILLLSVFYGVAFYLG